MKVITIAHLRQNPTDALNDVERGETYVITRHNREIGRIVPPERNDAVTPEQLATTLATTPVSAAWDDELRAARADLDGDDPWGDR